MNRICAVLYHAYGPATAAERITKYERKWRRQSTNGILPEAKSYPYAPAPGPVGLYLSMMYTYVIHTFACGSCRAACGAHSLRRVLTLTYLSLLLVL
jgi:hypothetical protein